MFLVTKSASRAKRLVCGAPSNKTRHKRAYRARRRAVRQALREAVSHGEAREEIKLPLRSEHRVTAWDVS